MKVIINIITNIITEKNIHIRFIENELKNYRKKEERLEEQIKQLIYMNQCLRIDVEELNYHRKKVYYTIKYWKLNKDNKQLNAWTIKCDCGFKMTGHVPDDNFESTLKRFRIQHKDCLTYTRIA